MRSARPRRRARARRRSAGRPPPDSAGVRLPIGSRVRPAAAPRTAAPGWRVASVRRPARRATRAARAARRTPPPARGLDAGGNNPKAPGRRGELGDRQGGGLDRTKRRHHAGLDRCAERSFEAAYQGRRTSQRLDGPLAPARRHAVGPEHVKTAAVPTDEDDFGGGVADVDAGDDRHSQPVSPRRP